MTQGGLTWEALPDRKAARELEGFTCTSDPPRTDQGRRCPHPRPWEWEAQRHLRQAAQVLRPGDALLVGRDEAREIVVAAHIDYVEAARGLIAYINAFGVSVTQRRSGGAVADEALRFVWLTACEEARSRGVPSLVLIGKIHRHNRASQYACLRAGIEPGPVADAVGDYQVWALETVL